MHSGQNKMYFLALKKMIHAFLYIQSKNWLIIIILRSKEVVKLRFYYFVMFTKQIFVFR